MRKRDWSLIFLLVALCIMGLYHTGAIAEQVCLDKGNATEECARLTE